MAPEHQQREHEGSGEKDRRRGGGRKDEGKQKGRHKSWRKYVGARQQQCHISSRNAMIISLSLLPSLSFFVSFHPLHKFNSCSVKQTSSHPPKMEKEGRRAEDNSTQSTLFLPDLVALVLVADGQQVQQDLIEVAQSEVYPHHRYRISRGHLRAEERTRQRRRRRWEADTLRVKLFCSIVCCDRVLSCMMTEVIVSYSTGLYDNKCLLTPQKSPLNT